MGTVVQIRRASAQCRRLCFLIGQVRERRLLLLSRTGVRLSRSALLVTASYDTRVLLWSTVTGEIVKEFAHKIPVPLKIYAGGDNGSFVRSVAITAHNQFLVTACDDK